MQILCRTLFDCRQTGTTAHFRPSQAQYTDQAGNVIQNINDWNRSRNQQRNLETIMQMISLRAQPLIIVAPNQVGSRWQFVFEVETPGVYSITGDINNLDVLTNECKGIPMIVDLDEQKGLAAHLITSGSDQNIWFSTINTLEIK